MTNSFGPPGYKLPLVDVRCVREHRNRFRRDSFPELDRANSYYSASGRWPDVGWLLIDRANYNIITSSANGRYATDLQLTINDFVNPALTIRNLAIVQARCVTTGLSSDSNAIYLVEVTNSQGVIYNKWYQTPVNKQYNVRSPAYPSQYYSATLNGAIVWTWATMIGDLWAQAPLQLGTFPGLPITPLGTPENFVFVGVPLWETITLILNYLGLTVSGEYPNLSIVVSGGSDPTFTAQQLAYRKYLEDDFEYIDGGSGRVPGQVIVYFHRRNEIYGTEETVRNDSYQWQSIPNYAVSVLAPSAFTGAVGTGYLWDSFTVRYDQDGLPLATDVISANLIASERTTQFFNTIARGTAGYMRQVYTGVLPFTTGSLVDGVRWYNNAYTGNNDYNNYCGWRTEVIRGYVWEEVTFGTTLQGVTGLI